jgi:hypothetical protein
MNPTRNHIAVVNKAQMIGIKSGSLLCQSVFSQYARSVKVGSVAQIKIVYLSRKPKYHEETFIINRTSLFLF